MKEGLGWRKSCQQVELESLVGDLHLACKVVHLGTQLLRAWRGGGGVLDIALQSLQLSGVHPHLKKLNF